ncbi:MAG: PID-CTERM protein-sorting domain-containing protein [Bacteroidia bacterium]
MKKIFFITLFFGFGYIASAQPGNPTPPVPLDGGISLLVAAGAAYGVKKFRDSRKAE